MFSIITPTYNRRHTLPRVYDSLVNQTFKDFKWIIVDDASTDGTQDLVNHWIQTSDLQIEYHLLPQNQGKPAAVNHGLDICDRTYTIIADSDDGFIETTLEQLRSIWQTVEHCSQNIGAIWTLTKNEQKEVQGDLFPKDIWQVNFQDRVLNIKKPISGDKWHCWKTESLKNQKLFWSEKCHIQESLTWNEINKKYDFLCLNISFLNVFYTEGSLINSTKSRKQNAITYYYGSYYGLRDVAASKIFSNSFYQNLAFEYIKSKLYYSDSKLKLSTSKYLVSLLVFIKEMPLRMIHKLV